MTGRRHVRIALLRGINVGGHNRVPMAELRTLCEELGWTGVRTYIASGNVVFGAAADPPALESELESAIEDRFGLSVAVIVRDAEAWHAYAEANPFPVASGNEPNRVALVLAKSPPLAGAAPGLRERAADGERVERVGDVLWVHFPQGAGRSRLSPSAMERLVGSPVTARNWRTVRKLAELARYPAGETAS